MTYTHDIFISYTSADRGWAEKLEADLVSRGLKVFRDKSRLDVATSKPGEVAAWTDETASLAPLSVA